MNHAHREREKENVSRPGRLFVVGPGPGPTTQYTLSRSPASPLAVTCARRRGNASRIGRRARRRPRDSAAMPNRPFRSRPFVRKEPRLLRGGRSATSRIVRVLASRAASSSSSSSFTPPPPPHLIAIATHSHTQLTRCCLDPRPLPSHSKTSFRRVNNSGIMISAALVAVVLALGACLSLFLAVLRGNFPGSLPAELSTRTVARATGLATP